MFLQPHILFIFSSLVPTCFGFMHVCLYMRESWRTLHMHLIFKVHTDDCHHGWVMIVEWSFIHFWLVILEGWNIPHEFQLVAILLDVYGMSFMFWLVLVDCVGWLVSHFLLHWDGGKLYVLWWSTRCDSYLKSKKIPLSLFSVLFNSFSRLMFFLACEKMSQGNLQPLESGLLTPKKFTWGTWFSVGRLAVFQVQREQWVSSS